LLFRTMEGKHISVGSGCGMSFFCVGSTDVEASIQASDQDACGTLEGAITTSTW
jgi:hypothetical protein